MSNTSVTMTKERRSSSLPWIKVPRLALRGTAKRKQSDAVLPINAMNSPLLDLPNELVINIVSSIELVDLLSLRGTNRALNSLMTSQDSDIARYWSRYQLEHIPKLLGQKPEDGQHWQYILRQSRRWQMASTFADVIKDYIQYKTFLHANAQRNLRFAPVARQIRRRMIPLLFTLSTYLSQAKSMVLDLADSDHVSIDCEAHMDAMTSAMFEGVDLADLKEVHYMWLFILWLLNSILSVPTYAGTLERTVRGWTADPLDRCSLAKLLVLGNLPAIQKLVRLRDYKERRRWAEGFLSSLNPDVTSKWAERWKDLDVGLDPLPLNVQAKKAMKMEINMQCLWMQGAAMVFEKAGGDHALMDDEKHPSATTTVRLLAELAGYDLFHAPVPHDYGEENSSSSSSSSAREGSVRRDQDGQEGDEVYEQA
ncbi:hypothetical protein KVT40_001907 [Elsinoe batatas]|uniref:F-box domain-containing protein n=1 Tax=Elsinoe batatas TaxID=2601811 RepID=A0A8K0L8Y2_9PEZI|nr:hypothetical protein KVT40_001907 [Elsinoe batatas]